MRQPLPTKRFFRRALLVVASGLLLSGVLSGVLGPRLSGVSEDLVTAGTDWRLLVDGLVDRVLSLTLNELAAMPRSTVDAELWCVMPGSVPPTFLVTSGNWTGVRLEFLLEQAGVHPQAAIVEFYAEDGYSTNISVVGALRKDVILAYEKDSVPLPETLRLVFPGAPGYTWISMITHIKLVKPDFKGLMIETTGPSSAHEGDTIEYTIAVRNLDSHSPLAGVTVEEERAGFDWQGDLAVQESRIFRAPYVVPLGAGDPLHTKATVLAELDGSEIYAEDVWTVDILHPRLKVSRTVTPSEVYAGDDVTHTIVITNTGDTPLFSLTLVDSVYGYPSRDLIPSRLEPGASFVWSFNASVYETMDNVVTSTGVDALGKRVSDSHRSLVEVRSDKDGISRMADWLFPTYAPHIIIGTATIILTVGSILFLKRTKR